MDEAVQNERTNAQKLENKEKELKTAQIDLESMKKEIENLKIMISSKELEGSGSLKLIESEK